MANQEDNKSYSEHKLVAIMFTDIVGYTKMMGRDESRALKILENNRTLHKDLLTLYHGQLLKEIGDGMLCSFDSASQAVKCGIELVRKSNEYKNLKLRIGIHIGEVVFSTSDVFGDGVNIASRIEAMATADSVLISARVFEDIKNKHNIKVRRLGVFQLKNDVKPREIYAIANYGLKVPSEKDLSGIKPGILNEVQKEVTDISLARTEKSKKWINMANPRVGLTLIFTFMAIVFGSFLFINFRNNTRVKWAREEAILQIEDYIEREQLKQAFHLAKEAEKYIPHDPLLKRLWPKMDFMLTMNSDPEGAKVYRKLVGESNSEYELLGTTPLDSVHTYNRFSIWKIEKEGYLPLEFVNVIWVVQDKTYRLFKKGELPDNMVYVPFDQWAYFPTGWISGLGNVQRPEMKDYLIDKYEVSNKSYKEFVNNGGYSNKAYWKIPFIKNGITISWEEAMKEFVDKTGQPGPSTWQIGDYPDGQDTFPVNGVSWYEAMAYAEYSGKTLPSLFHWIYAACPGRGDLINPESNFLGNGPEPRGANTGIGVYGTLDMAGNVREWCLNKTAGKNNRFILGGAWDELPYNFSNARALDPFDRSPMNGFRCVQYLEDDENSEIIMADIPLRFRDYNIEKPVDHKTYQLFLHDFEYEKTAFEEEVQNVDFGDADFTCQKIFMNSTYNDERLCLYLFLPTDDKDPFQAIYYFPSAWANELDDFEANFELIRFEFDFYLKSGRAVAYPIFPGMYGRDAIGNSLLSGPARRKANVIATVKDIQRHLDYLNSRDDISNNEIGYYGFSLGSLVGPIPCAVENRFKAAVWTVGGLGFGQHFPETDPFNYLPRVSIPVLMLNGRHDHVFPLDESPKIMFDYLGTPEQHKKMILYDVGHQGPPRYELIKESLNWFDTYLGPVGKDS